MRFLLSPVLMLCLIPQARAEPPGELPIVPAGPDFEPGVYMGRIVSMTKDGLVIKPERGAGTERSITLPDGRPARLVYKQDNSRPAREFVFDDCLFPERPGSKVPRVGEHELGELQVGDVVWIRYVVEKGVASCTSVTIHRRPQGRVPLAILDEKCESEYRHSTRCNTEQFIEEKVIAVKLPRLFARLHP